MSSGAAHSFVLELLHGWTRPSSRLCKPSVAPACWYACLVKSSHNWYLLEGAVRLCPSCMDLTLEAYRIVLEHTTSRSDIASLCRVSKKIKRAAEPALYHDIFLSNPDDALSLSSTLSECPRLAALVNSLTISLMEDDDADGEGTQEWDETHRLELPSGFWDSVASGLQETRNLQYLTIHSQNAPIPARAAILRNVPFSLKGFHCDFDWDDDMIQFLNAQTALEDLYILDYDQRTSSTCQSHTSSQATARGDYAPSSSISTTKFNASAMPALATLECTFSEAADLLVPYRPITHLKTCFSKTELAEKRVERNRLFASLSLSSRCLRSLDIADSSYSESFAMDMLRKVVNTKVTSADLRYLGTLVLPIDGAERLQFYGVLMRLPSLRCIEMEVSEWDPPPSTPAAFRALASELRLYCPMVTSVVFVLDFERTLVTISNGVCTVNMDGSTDLLWREM